MATRSKKRAAVTTRYCKCCKEAKPFTTGSFIFGDICRACYMALYRRIKKGEITLQELIDEGVFAKAQKSPVDKLVAAIKGKRS